MVIFDDNACPLMFPVSLETGRKWCLGEITRIAPNTHIHHGGPCLYIGNVMNRNDMFEAFRQWKKWAHHGRQLVILSTHSRGIYNLALKCGFTICAVEDRENFEGTRFVGEPEHINKMVAKFSRIAAKKQAKCLT